MSDIIQNPYVGPRTFTQAEADRYYGRDTEAADLLSLVISERLVLFYAQSGAGKSSLINTRLAPGLQAEGFLTLPVGRVSGELPAGIEQVDNVFVFNLLLSLDQGDSAPDRFAHMSVTDFLAHLNTTDGEHYFFDDSPPNTDDEDVGDYEEPAHVLIIDQFEEIVTTHLDRWQERSTFFRQLEQAMANDPLLWIVLTLREDYVAALDPYAHLLPGKMRARYYMQRMGYDAALEAVKRPAEQGGRAFDDGVAETLVDNLRQVRAQGEATTRPGQFVEPVQLQVVCYQLWKNLEGRPAGAITLQDWRESGDVDTALAEFYEQALKRTLQQCDVSEIDLRTWFDQKLITTDETRGTVYQGKNDTAGLPNLVAKSLADQFLLRAEIRSGGVWYELVHDRFVNPILKANQAWQQEQLLKEQAKAVRRSRWLIGFGGMLLMLLVYVSWLGFRNYQQSTALTRVIQDVLAKELPKMLDEGDGLHFTWDIVELQNDNELRLEVQVNSLISPSHRDVVDLQFRVANALQEAGLVDLEHQYISLVLIVIPTIALDPHIPPTPTNTPTFTLTPTPNSTNNVSPAISLTLTAIPNLQMPTSTPKPVSIPADVDDSTIVEQILTEEISQLAPATSLASWSAEKDDEGILRLQIYIISNTNPTDRSVTDLQERVINRFREAGVMPLDQPLALEVSRTMVLSPATPPTPTRTPTFTPTPTPTPH